jgi:peptidoglycan/LPS O-acetylase OafA/YrhL
MFTFKRSVPVFYATTEGHTLRNSQEPAEQSLLHTMRQLLLVLVTAGMLGTAADLLLLEHFENAWQLPPLVLIGIALLVVARLFISGGAVAVIAMRVIMICFIAAGCVGILLHYNGNSEFQREIDPAWPAGASLYLSTSIATLARPR